MCINDFLAVFLCCPKLTNGKLWQLGWVAKEVYMGNKTQRIKYIYAKMEAMDTEKRQRWCSHDAHKSVSWCFLIMQIYCIAIWILFLAAHVDVFSSTTNTSNIKLEELFYLDAVNRAHLLCQFSSTPANSSPKLFQWPLLYPKNLTRKFPWLPEN